MIGDKRGFTLLEMAVVMLLLGMAAAIVFPRLPGVAESRLDDSGRQVAGLLRTALESAATTRRPLIARASFPRGELSVLAPGEAGELAESTDPSLLPLRLNEEVSIQDIVTADGEKHASGVVDIPISGDDLLRPIVVHLRQKDQVVTATVYPSLKSQTESGYKECGFEQ